MLAAIEYIATLSSTLFTGAAIYINLVEHPARMGCDTKIAFTQWAPSYKDRETKPRKQRKPRQQRCHCEELEATKHSQDAGKDCFAALAMTPGL